MSKSIKQLRESVEPGLCFNEDWVPEYDMTKSIESANNAKRWVSGILRKNVVYHGHPDGRMHHSFILSKLQSEMAGGLTASIPFLEAGRLLDKELSSDKTKMGFYHVETKRFKEVGQSFDRAKKYQKHIQYEGRGTG